MKYRDKVVL